jgi:hypothetical protein
MEIKMREGTINCECGQSFYFETVNTQIACIKCNKMHDVSGYPFKEEIQEIEEVEEQPE